eukprot:CAMPEP_0196809544 /NCGR_PEP_ID=MMETSP1362-20130617/9465_1 /TAXON_ID=163516 /ORGANISM="Leptocylindrus danicus, Strain CCMP1856" /LENGTH=418 /DNA_ID=CAMNT_0042184267 /DNA_START=208 /DNA_END=1464 /DNA_ORIENTATION=-
MSMAGSCYIIWKVVGDKEKRETKWTRMYHRLLFSMSVCDVLSSFGLFLGSWPSPADNLNESIYDIDLIGNVGNTSTCNAQGFIVTLGASGTNCYNAILAVYFLLIVKYGWPETRLQKIEKIFHLYGTVVPFSISLGFLLLGWYSTAVPTCFVMAYPWGCFLDDTEHECIRQPQLWNGVMSYGTLTLIAVMAINLVVISSCMIRTMLHVRRIEKKALRFAADRGIRQRNQLRKSKMVLKVACWYIFSYIMILVSFAVLALVEAGEYTVPICSFFLSSQGTINAIVYSNFETVNALSKMCCGQNKNVLSNMWSTTASIARRVSFDSQVSRKILDRNFNDNDEQIHTNAKSVVPGPEDFIDEGTESIYSSRRIERDKATVPENYTSTLKKLDYSIEESKMNIDASEIFDSDFDEDKNISPQ